MENEWKMQPPGAVTHHVTRGRRGGYSWIEGWI